MAASLESPDLVVCHRLDEFRGSWIAPEEVFANESAVFSFVGLVVAVGSFVHQINKRAVGVASQQFVPFATPNNLDDIPASASEEALQFLNNFSVASNRTIKSLKVAVDDES